MIKINFENNCFENNFENNWVKYWLFLFFKVLPDARLILLWFFLNIDIKFARN